MNIRNLRGGAFCPRDGAGQGKNPRNGANRLIPRQRVYLFGFGHRGWSAIRGTKYDPVEEKTSTSNDLRGGRYLSGTHGSKNEIPLMLIFIKLIL